MAQKQLNAVEILITKDISTGEVNAQMSAICWSPELETRFGVNLPLTGVDDIANNAVAALKEHMADGGKHDVTDCPPPESEAE